MISNDGITNAKDEGRGLLEMCTSWYKGGGEWGVEKLVIRRIHTKWMPPPLKCINLT